MHFYISEELVQAYKITDYHVTTTSPFVLNIDSYSEPLKKMHLNHNCTSSAFLTAYCPFSKTLSAKENERLQKTLEDELSDNNFQFIDGFGQGKGASVNWKERSVLVLGISLKDATKLANKYKQNAFIWNDVECIPRLITL